MTDRDKIKSVRSLMGCCAAIFWPGAFIFGLPGVLGSTWKERFGVGQTEVGQTLFFVLAAVGFFMFISGRLLERLGPPRLVGAGVAICGISTVLVGYCNAIWGVYLWAFIVGIASTLIYLPGLIVVQRWFPHRRGLVSGIVNFFFGFSAAIMSPVFGYSLKQIGYENTTLCFGLAALVIGLVAAPLCVNPGGGHVEATGKGDAPVHSVKSLSVRQGLRTRPFWSLWGVWAMAGAAGIAMVPLSTAFGISRGLDLQGAIVILLSFNLTNGLSRLISGYLSDMWSRNHTMSLTFAASGCAYLIFAHAEGLLAWSFLAAVIGFAFGTLFAVSAPLASDCFGLRHFGTIFGLVFTAYGFLAGLLGPFLSGVFLDRTGGNFTPVFYYLGGFLLVSAVLVQFVRPSQIPEAAP